MLTSKIGIIYSWQSSYRVYVTVGSHISFVISIYWILCIQYL